MTLHALLSAIETTGDGSHLRATQMVAGQYLLERQAGICRAAGAQLLFVSVEGMTDALVTAFDRLRAAGFSVEPVRRASEIVDRTHGRDQLMLVLDGLYANADQVAAFAAGPAQSVFVTDDSPVTRGLERIDADRRWAGLAMTRCDMLAELADVPDDWDLASTVLRRAVQRGATKLPCDPGLFERGELIVVDGAIAAGALSEKVYDSAAVGESGLAMANVLAPLARFIGPALLRGGVRATAFELGAIALALLALAGWATGWIGTGAAIGFGAIMATALTRYLGLFTLEPPRPLWRARALTVLPIVAFAVLAANMIWRLPASWSSAALLLIFTLTLVHAANVPIATISKAMRRLLPDAGLGFTVIGLSALADRTDLGTGGLAVYGAAMLTLCSVRKSRENR